MIRDIELTTDNVKQFADGIHNDCWLELDLGIFFFLAVFV